MKTTGDNMPKGIFTKNLQDLTKSSVVVSNNGSYRNEELMNESTKELKELLEKAKPELNCFGYVFMKEKNGNFSTVRVNFDEALTTAEFSEKEFAGSDKQIAIEKLKIKLGQKVF
jgi:hypothetical protein